MNDRIKLTAVALLITVLAVCFLPFSSFAKDMEECSLCGTTGVYYCNNCGNAGETVCDGCGGAGQSVCPGEQGKGKCDNGWYVCPSCKGDGLSRPIPADGNAGTCGQCGGSGKLECWNCHGAGILICDRCGGDGKCECRNVNCIEARKIGGKCPRCRGTGYTGDGQDFPPEWNDGVHNIPAAGDHIITDHSNWTGYYYGTGITDAQLREEENNGYTDQQAPDAGEGGNDQARDPATGRDYVWFIDVGDGLWNVNGRDVTVKRYGQPVTGVIDVKYSEPFTIEGIEDRRTHVFLEGDDGFRVELLELNGDHEYSVENREPASSTVPFNVNLSIVFEEDAESPDGADEPGRDDPEERAGEDVRRIDFCGGTWNVEGVDITAWIDGKQAEGIIEVKYFDEIKLKGFDGEKMSVRLCAEDGFTVTLTPNGKNEVSIGRYEQEECVLADGSPLKFVVEQKEDAEPEDTEDRAEKNEAGDAGVKKPGPGTVIVVVCAAAAASVGAALFIVKKKKEIENEKTVLRHHRTCNAGLPRLVRKNERRHGKNR
ncbi:MAG: hypothetical protein IJU75_03855 [Clostridia bacterium]|nr:hypothetical protein [Clostridia bacterium]MBR0302609.1 hypothetical protein [Clostridia bacterium]